MADKGIDEQDIDAVFNKHRKKSDGSKAHKSKKHKSDKAISPKFKKRESAKASSPQDLPKALAPPLPKKVVQLAWAMVVHFLTGGYFQ